MSSDSFDVAIVGAGPAGSVLAGHLASWGRTVALIDRGGARSGVPEETLVPGAAAVLKRVGAMAVVRAHKFFGTPRHAIVWGDGEIRWRTTNSLEDRGFKVRRNLFDHDLRTTAKGLGAKLFLEHDVRGPVPADGGTVELGTAGGGRTPLTAGLWVVATGRTGPTPLIDAEIERVLPETLALSCLIDPQGHRTDATIIEALPEGWMWWLPLHDGRACVTLFADGGEVRERGRDAIFAAAAAGSGAAGIGVEGGPDAGCVATARLCRAKTPVLLCGGAASTIDPLSSQGVEKALASAERAALAVNTILDEPELRDTVLEHHHAWERDLFLSHARRTLRWYLDEVRFSDCPFWRRRHAMVQVQSDPAADAGLPEFVRRSPRLVRKATMRQKGRRLVRHEGWGLREELDVYASLGRVPLDPLLLLLESTHSVDEIAAWAARDPDLCLLNRATILQALTELLRLGMIESHDTGE